MLKAASPSASPGSNRSKSSRCCEISAACCKPPRVRQRTRRWPRAISSCGRDDPAPATTTRCSSRRRCSRLLRVAERLAATNLPILLNGETGTGKEVLARVIHERSLGPARAVCAVQLLGRPARVGREPTFRSSTRRLHRRVRARARRDSERGARHVVPGRNRGSRARDPTEAVAVSGGWRDPRGRRRPAATRLGPRRDGDPRGPRDAHRRRAVPSRSLLSDRLRPDHAAAAAAIAKTKSPRSRRSSWRVSRRRAAVRTCGSVTTSSRPCFSTTGRATFASSPTRCIGSPRWRPTGMSSARQRPQSADRARLERAAGDASRHSTRRASASVSINRSRTRSKISSAVYRARALVLWRPRRRSGAVAWPLAQGPVPQAPAAGIPGILTLIDATSRKPST